MHAKKSLRNFTNLTAKEYQYAMQKLLFCIGPGSVASSLLPEAIAVPLRGLLMKCSDMLLYGSMHHWDEEVYGKSLHVCDSIGMVYKEVFFRPASYKKNDKVVYTRYSHCL
jgi:hypothetical protein